MYPWPSFGSFMFKVEETAIQDSDTEWKGPALQVQRTIPIGGNRDTVVILGAASQEREFECHLTQARFEELKAAIGQTQDFCDWRRPVPNVRPALLLTVELVAKVLVFCNDAEGIGWRIRTRVALLEQ